MHFFLQELCFLNIFCLTNIKLELHLIRPINYDLFSMFDFFKHYFIYYRIRFNRYDLKLCHGQEYIDHMPQRYQSLPLLVILIYRFYLNTIDLLFFYLPEKCIEMNQGFIRKFKLIISSLILIF